MAFMLAFMFRGCRGKSVISCRRATSNTIGGIHPQFQHNPNALANPKFQQITPGFTVGSMSRRSFSTTIEVDVEPMAENNPIETTFDPKVKKSKVKELQDRYPGLKTRDIP